MKDLLFMLLGVALLTLLILAIILPIAYWWGASRCDAQWVEFEHRFGAFSGCMVQYEGTWYPEDIVRTMIEP